QTGHDVVRLDVERIVPASAVGLDELVSVEILLLEAQFEVVAHRNAQLGDALPRPRIVVIVKEGRARRRVVIAEPSTTRAYADVKADTAVAAEIEQGVGHRGGDPRVAGCARIISDRNGQRGTRSD